MWIVDMDANTAGDTVQSVSENTKAGTNSCDRPT